MFTRSNLVLGLLAALLCGSGCKRKVAPSPPPPPPESLIDTDVDNLRESLFRGDQAVLSGQDVERILSARIPLADRHRLVVLRLGSRNVFVQEIADIEAQNSMNFLKALAAAPHLTQVRFMPALLVPEKRTIPYLREAAARFQADLLLVYGTRIRTFGRTRVLGADTVAAEAAVESILLDVRTGIVVESHQASESILATRAKGDLNFSQTVSKTATEALGKALLHLADDVVRFLGRATD
jgi:hypothetical protein